MDVPERTPGDRAQLEEMIDREPNAKQRDRLRSAALAIDGRETEAIVDAVKRSRRFVQRWAYAYRDGGIEAIKVKRQPGPKPRLSKDQMERLAVRIEAGPTASDGVCALRGQDIARIIEKEFGQMYTLSGVYDLLERLGFSSLRPRPRHRKNDPAAMQAFKSSAPLLSRKPVKRTRASGLRSGSRTRPASGSRGR